MNPEYVSISIAVISIFISSVIIFLERAFPFLLFSKKQPPAIIRLIEKYIPPMAITALLFYCLKDMNFSAASGFVPSAVSLMVCIGLHIWKKNSLISIFGSTILYMTLLKII